MHRKTLTTAAVFGFFFIPSLSAEVKNHDKPVKGEWDLNPVKVWQVDKAGGDVFGLPFTLWVSDLGSLYIFDMENGINYIFDSGGKFKKSFARGGESFGRVLVL